jgi:gliding motility-associated-like protein
MNRIYLSVILLFTTSLFAQNIILDDNNPETFNCASIGNLISPGGASYGQNVQFVKTICTNGDPFSVELISASFGSNGDFLCVYDGLDATAPLITCFTVSNLPAPGFQIRSSINNVSGCLTFQFVSDNVTTGGSFSFAMSCLPACKSVEAVIAATIPPTEAANGIYINNCPGDTVSFFGQGFYDSNLGVYTQSDATSLFYWDFGDGTGDTTQNPRHIFPNGQIFVVTLQVEDVNACRSSNEINLRVRQAIEVDLLFNPITDKICLHDSTEFTAYIEGIVIGDSAYLDTITGQNAASVRDTVFLPDDSNGNSGDGITTPVVYPLEIYGYIPGTSLVDIQDLYSICLDIEHTFVGDLDIRLVCPNGQFTTLIDFSPPGTPGNNLGLANAAGTAPGTPFTYCWSPSSTSGSIDVGQPALLNDPVAAGTYQATGNWNNLLGCPLNGEWQIQIFDDYGGDDGNTFAASIEFNPFYLLDPDTFLVYYLNPMWDSNPEISSNLNDTTITAFASDTFPSWLYFNVENNMGCEFRDSVFFDVDFFKITAVPSDTAACLDSLQLNVILDGVPTQCVPTYTVSSIPVNAVSAASPTNVSLGDDALSATINMPFAFDFFCEPKASFQISSNGFISFTPAGNGCCSGQNLPTVGTPNDLIALYWSDLNPGSGGTIRHWTSGVAPNRVKVVEFTNVPHFASASTVSGQIQMFEGSNFVEIHCVNCQTDNGTITVGIENADGTAAYAAPGHNATGAAAIGQAWRFTPSNSLGNYSFNWTPNSFITNNAIVNPIVYPNVSTNYVIAVTNENNCTHRDTVELTLGNGFTVNASNDTTICLGESVQISASGANSYLWTPNNATINNNMIANPTVTPTLTSTYVVEGDSLGCTAFDTVQVFVLDNNVSLETADTTICQGQSVPLSVLGTTIVTWTPNNGSLSSTSIPNPVATPTATTTYTASMGPSQCAIDDQVTITVLPTAGQLLTPNSSICAGESIDLNASGASSYEWTPNDGSLSSLNTASTTATPSTTTSYTVVFNSGQCASSADVTITVNALPLVQINDGSASQTICAGDSFNFFTQSFPNYTYLWEDINGLDMSTSSSWYATEAGTYQLDVLDGNSCPGTAVVDLIVKVSPILDFTNLRTILCCTNDEVLVVPTDFLQNPNDVVVNQVIVNGNAMNSFTESSGNNSSYVVQVFSDQGCVAEETIEFITNCMNPQINAPDSVFIGTTNGVSVTHNNNGVSTAYSWTPAALFADASLENPNLEANSNDPLYNIEVVLTEQYQLNNSDSILTCSEIANAEIVTVSVGDPIFPDAFSPNGDNINQRFFPINLDNNSNLATLKVYDRWGKLVYDYKNLDLGWDGTFEGKDQAADVYSYYVKIEKPNGDYIRSGTLTLIR